MGGAGGEGHQLAGLDLVPQDQRIGALKLQRPFV